MTALLLALTLSQTPALVGPYTRLGNVDEASFLDGGSVLQGGMVFGTDAGLPYVYGGAYWSGIQTSTSAPMTLYVEADGGSDQTYCTGTGTSACKTIQGAINKVPRDIRHNVVINIAAGTYNETVRVQNYTLDNATLTISGSTTWNQFTPDAGSTTGTVTSYTAASGATAATFTDTGQSWAVDSLKGVYVRITSGANANTFRLITSNTATSVNLINNTTSSIAGATYELVLPSTIVSGGSVTEGTFNFRNVTTASVSISPVVLQDVTLTSSTGPALTVNGVFGGSTSSVGFILNRSRAVTTGSTASAYRIGRSSVQDNTNSGNYFESATGTAISLTNSRLLETGLARGGSASLCTVQVDTISQFTTGNLSNTVSVYEQLAAGSVLCVGGSGISSSVSYASLYNSVFRGVAGSTGILVTRGSRVDLVSGFAQRIENVTTGYSATLGGSMTFNSTTPTFSGVTNELSIDGTTYPFSTLTGLPAPQVISNSYGSALIR